MLCKKCGYTIPEDCQFCPKCGTKNETSQIQDITSNSTGIIEEVVVTNTDFNKQSPNAAHLEQPALAKKSFFKKKTVIIIIASVLVIAIGIFAWQLIGKNELKTQLMRDWERAEENDGTYYKLILDFSDNRIDYNFESAISWLDTTIGTFNYEVIAPNKIKITDGEYSKVTNIEFSKDKLIMTMTPAITSTDSTESWFNID